LGKRTKMPEPQTNEALTPMETSGSKLGVILLGILVASLLLPAMVQVVTAQPGDRQGMRGDLSVYYTVKSILATVNSILLVVLLIVYVSIYSGTRAEFLLGLIIFDIAMLLYAITSNPLVTAGFGFRGAGLGPFAMLPDLFSLVAVLVLLWQAFRYR